jgi:regulatory protein
MTDAERPDDSLAPVTYLFGAPGAEAESAGRSALPLASRQHASQWATPGVEFDQAAEPDAPADPDPTPDTTRAHNVGLHALTRRGQSVAEMTKLLESRELEPEVVQAEIKRLKSVGLLDDFALAETLVRTLSERKKLGKSSIASQLRQRKINPVAIDAALEQLDGDDELVRATEVAIKRAGQLRSYDQETAKRRLSAFLQRRGYSGTVLSAAMSAALHPSASASRSGGPRFE